MHTMHSDWLDAQPYFAHTRWVSVVLGIFKTTDDIQQNKSAINLNQKGRQLNTWTNWTPTVLQRKLSIEYPKFEQWQDEKWSSKWMDGRWRKKNHFAKSAPLSSRIGIRLNLAAGAAEQVELVTGNWEFIDGKKSLFCQHLCSTPPLLLRFPAKNAGATCETSPLRACLST